MGFLLCSSEQWKKGPLVVWGIYRRWNTTQLCFFYFNHETRIPSWNKQDSMESFGRFFLLTLSEGLQNSLWIATRLKFTLPGNDRIFRYGSFARHGCESMIFRLSKFGGISDCSLEGIKVSVDVFGTFDFHTRHRRLGFWYFISTTISRILHFHNDVSGCIRLWNMAPCEG